MTITRRDVLKRGGVAVAFGGTAASAAIAAVPHSADPLREGVQTLVNEIREREGSLRNITTASFGALQEAADRLEALPGIEPAQNEHWTAWQEALPEHRRGWGHVLTAVESAEGGVS